MRRYLQYVKSMEVEKMQIKTFTDNTKEGIDRQVNKFEEDHKVKFTQTHYSTYGDIGVSVEKFVYVVFYEVK